MAGDLFAQLSYLPDWTHWWLAWHQLILLALPVLFLARSQAQMLLSAHLLNLFATAWIFYLQTGVVTKLFGLGHLFWYVAAGILVAEHFKRSGSPESSGFFKAWLVLALTTIIASAPFDFHDWWLYASGTRMSLMEYFAVHRA